MAPERRSFPWRVQLTGAACIALCKAARVTGGTVSRRILSLLDRRVPPNPNPVEGVATSDHVVDPARNLSVRLFSPISPSSSSPLPVLVYFHGGGFVHSSPFSRVYDGFCRRLSRAVPARVVSVDYRLAPEHRFPAAYDDCFDVVAWLDSGNLIGGAPTNVFLAGDSAGGNIAHHVARRCAAATTASSFERVRVAGVVAIQPFFGGAEDTESEKRLGGVDIPFSSREMHRWMWRSYLPRGSCLDHEAADPFIGPTSVVEEWTGFPPTMVAVGGQDMLRERDMRYYEGLKKAGVQACLKEYPNAVHAFYIFPFLPESKQHLLDVADFADKCLNTK